MYGLHKFWLQYYLKLIFLFNINNTFKISIYFLVKPINLIFVYLLLLIKKSFNPKQKYLYQYLAFFGQNVVAEKGCTSTFPHLLYVIGWHGMHVPVMDGIQSRETLHQCA